MAVGSTDIELFTMKQEEVLESVILETTKKFAN